VRLRAKIAVTGDGLRGAGVAVVLVAAAVALLLPVRSTVPPASVALVLVVPVVASIAIGGVVPGVVAIAAGFLAYDVYFIPPFGTLAVGRGINWLPLGIYVVVGGIAIVLEERFRRQRLFALRQARVLGELAELPGRLFAAPTRRALYAATVEVLAKLTEAGGAAVFDVASPLDDVVSDASDPHVGVLREAFVPARASGGTIFFELPRLSARGFPLATLQGLVGMLVVWSERLDDAVVGAVDVVAHQLSSALERERLREVEVRVRTLEQADRWRVSLLRTVSHDLLTPLASIETALSTIEAYGHQLSDDDRTELVATALAQSRRSSALVKDLLDVNRIEAGVRHLEAEPCELVELAKDVAASMAAVGVPESVRVCAEPPVVAQVDRALVRQVLWNLVDNAVRHNRLGAEVVVDVRQEADEVVLEVHDQGSLPEEAKAEAVFDWFHAAGASGRTGLGLAIARSFVEAHGGEVTMSSTDEGTTVRVRLPRCQRVNC